MMVKQYKAPSMQTLQGLHWLSESQKQQIRQLIRGEVDPQQYETVREWVEHCSHEPEWIEQVMCAIDEVIETHGVEAIWHKGKVKVLYCNTGEAYQATVIYRYDTDSFSVAAWGDLVERYGWDGQQ